MGFMIETKKNKERTLIDFLDLEIDIRARLPMDKHHRALEIVSEFTQEQSIPFYKLEKLLGFLSFCCEIVLT